MKRLNRMELIAPCGINCALCLGYLREKDTCPGCRGLSVHDRSSCVRCKIRTCASLRRRKLKYCSGCPTFPCSLIKRLDKRYRTRYHVSVLENFADIEKYGIRKFTAAEKKKWTCPSCGGTICMHRDRCLACGYEVKRG